ncbi:MAG: CHAT domain-containing protein [Anaerolineae bacterium]|nr:CHAT domain-containing protein [Anaerolineae bacterium]
MPQIQPQKALGRIDAIVTVLIVSWNELSTEEQEQVEALYEQMREAYAAAQWDFQQGEAVVTFLQALDAMPGVRALVGHLIDETKGPKTRGGAGDPDLLDRLPDRLDRGIQGEPVGPPVMAAPPPKLWESPEAGPPHLSMTRGEESLEETAEALHEKPTLLTRYPNLDCPDQVIVNERFSLFVQLLIEAPEPEAEAITIEDTGEPEHPPEVEIVVRARGFDIEGSNTRTIQVDREDDTEERFVLIPRRLGDQQIRVDFYQFGRRIGTIRRNVLVVEHLVEGETPQPEELAVLELRTAPTIPPPDLELCVELDRHDSRTLYFELHSTKEKVGYNHAKFGQVTLQGSPLEKMQAVYQEMSRMAGTAPSTPEERAYAERRLAAIGNELWDELIPNELKREYWRFKRHVHSILVTSDEPWMPWEIIKPYRYNNEGEREDEPFLCQQFAISRWLSGPGTADLLPVGAARPVAPSRINLRSVQEELSFVGQLDQLRPGIVPLAPFSDRLQVLDWLEHGEFSVLHFACHGQFDATLPNDSAITLSGGPLRPSDIRARFGGRRPRPLIFINACYGAREEFSFTGLGGWASRLVKDARVGAFIGAMWEVNDALALQFARRFYKALLQENHIISDAFRLAREEIRQAAPYNSTWLAYVLYADPEGRMQE